MTNTYIAIALIGIVASQLFNLSKRTRKEAYQWWYTPWASLLYSALVCLLYLKVGIPDLSFITSLFLDDHVIESLYTLLCMAVWLLLRLLLRKSSVFTSLTNLFRKLFAKGREDKDRVLPFPYFIDEQNVVRAKVGLEFYRWTLKLLVVLLSLVYAIVFLLLDFNVLSTFWPRSAFGMLGLLPLLEYYLYLCAEVPTEEEQVSEHDNPFGWSNFDKLWELYVDTFDNYIVAWRKTCSKEEQLLALEKEKGNDRDFNEKIRDFLNPEKRTQPIIEKYDITSAFLKLEPIFNHVENNGQRILVALDIPNHFTQNKEKTYTEEIAGQLSGILKKDFCVYGKKSAQSTLSNSIIISPLSLLSRQRLNEEWMQKIGLLVVVNLFDKGVSNMYECLKFSCILQSMNKNYQMAFITPYRRDVEPSLHHTWLTGNATAEIVKELSPKANRQYFIGYNFEDFQERFNKILTGMPPEPLYSGSELATLALSSRNGEEKKEVTPVHFLDLAYSNAIEGKEELTKFTDYITSQHLVTKNDINDYLSNHLLPVEQIPDDQVFAIIYDVENNVPAVYSKWMHLGKKENFSIVVSKPYLFRDYFNANHDYFVHSPFAALQPHLCKSRLTLAIILLSMLQKTEMEEKKLRELLHEYYGEDEIVSVSQIIRQLFRTYFSNDIGSLLMTRDETVFIDGEYQHRLYYNLSQLTEANNPPYLDIVTVKDESGNVLIDLLSDLMYQNYDEEQIHSFSGKPYRIRDFNRSTKTLNVSKVNNSRYDILFYRPVQQIDIATEKVPIKHLCFTPPKWRHPVTGEPISIRFEGYETDVKVHTNSWYEFYRYTVKDCSYRDCTCERHYPHGKVLKITFGYMKKDDYRNRIGDIRKSLQLLLYEAMRSVFPHNAQYLIISTLGDGDTSLPWIFNRLNLWDTEKAGELSFYFIEDAHIDLGLIGALAADEQNIWYILKYIYDYLIWLTEDFVSADNGEGAQADVSVRIPTVYDQYLERQPFDKTTFLKYGREQLPPYFDIDLLINFIKDLFQNGAELQKNNTDRQSKNDIIGCCDFCGKKMKNSEMQRLDDGRMRCPECSKEAIDTDGQFQELCQKVEEAFKTHLGIDFGTIPHHAKLVSAVELHKSGNYKFSITNGYDIRKIIGLAFDVSEVDYICVESGYKPDKTFGIIAHELTHIWEFSNADFAKVRPSNEDLLEGLAVWTDLFLSEKNGCPNIEGFRKSWLSRDDEYGRGLRFIMANCPDDPYGYIADKAKSI